MITRKCVRCGKYYIENNNEYFRHGKRSNKISIYIKENIYDTYYLCSECMSKLMSFLERTE